MLRQGCTRVVAVAVLAVFLSTPASRADVFEDLAHGLGYAGFNIEGQRNHLSGGADYRISHNLQGNSLDFGPGDLRLQGPISLEFRTTGRGFHNMDIELQTALTSDFTSQPLNYVLTYDAGSQQTEISGNLYIDASLSLNGFGFYDLDLDYSSRQNVVRDGRFSDGTDTFDFDAGPIHVRGNIFADMLAAVTAPFFEAAGTVNPFASFSASAKLAQAIEASNEEMISQLAAGVDPLASEMALRMSPGDSSGPLPGAYEDTGPSGTLVPEPTVLVLMLLGVPALMRHRRRA